MIRTGGPEDTPAGPSATEGSASTVNVGEPVAYLRSFPPETPVVVDVNTDEGVYLRVEAEDLFITSDEGDGPDGIEAVLSWDPPAGWLQALMAGADETRQALGLGPLDAPG